MSPELEKHVAALIKEIGDLEVDLATSATAHDRLRTVKQSVERLYRQTIAERRRIELSESDVADLA